MSARRMMPRSYSYSGDGRSSSSYNGDDVSGSSRPASAASRSYLSSVRPENRSTLCSVMAHLTEENQPSFEMTLKSKAVSESCNVKFTCMVTGHPTPRVIWYKDDMQLDRYCGLPKYEISHDGQNHSLHIFNCSVDDAAIYQASASNSKGIVSCSGVLEVGVMSEFLIHQRYFSKLKQKAENKRRDLDSKQNQQEQLRTISPDRSQRKRRSPMEVNLSTPSSTEEEEAVIQFPVSQAEVRLQDADNVEAEENPLHATNGTTSPITNGQAANENGSKAVTYVYDSVQKTFTSHQPKAPFIKKKIKISNGADGVKPDTPVEMVTGERLANEQACEKSSLKESSRPQGPSEEVMEEESAVVSSASASEKETKQHQTTPAAETEAQPPTSEPSEKQMPRVQRNAEAPSLKKQISVPGPPAPVSPAVASSTCHISSGTDSTHTAKPEKGVGHTESLSPPVLSTQQALHPVTSPKTSSKDTVIAVTRQEDVTAMDVDADAKPLVMECQDHTAESVNVTVDTATVHPQRPPEMSVNGTEVHRNLKSASASALDKETKQHQRAEKKARPPLDAPSEKQKARVPGNTEAPSQRKQIAVPGPPAPVSPAVAPPTRHILSGTESKPDAKPEKVVGHAESLSPPIVSTQQPSHPITSPETSSKDTSKEVVAVTQQASHPIASPETTIKDAVKEVVAVTRQEEVTAMKVDEKPLVTRYQEHTAQAVNVRVDTATTHPQRPHETSVNGTSVHRNLKSAGGGDALPSRPPCEPQDQLSGREGSSGQKNVCVSGPSPLGKAHTQTSWNDAPVNIELQPARRETTARPLQRPRPQREPAPDDNQTPALHHPVLAASDAMSQGTWAHSRGSNESRAVPFTEIQKSPVESPAEGEKTPGCNVSPTVPQCQVEKAIKAVEQTEIQVDEKLEGNKLTSQVHGDTLGPAGKKATMETDLPLNTSEHAKTESTIGDMRKEASDITMADVSNIEMDKNDPVLKKTEDVPKSPNFNPEKPKIQKRNLLEQRDEFKEIPTPVSEVISIAELLRAQMKALGSSVSTMSPTSAEDEQCPTAPQVQMTTERRQELASGHRECRLEAEKPKPDRLMKMSVDSSPASNIKSEHLQAHHRIVKAEREPIQSPNAPSPNTESLKIPPVIPPIAVTDADSTLKNAIILPGSTAKENDSVMDTDQVSVASALVPLKDNPDICLLGAENVKINVSRSAPKQHTADKVSLISNPSVIIVPEHRMPPANAEIEMSYVHSPRVISVLEHDTEINCHSKDTELQNQNAALNTDIINEGHSTSTTKSGLGTDTHMLNFPHIKQDISRSMAEDLSKTASLSLLSDTETNISRRSNSPVLMTPELRKPLADVVTERYSVHNSTDGQKLFHCKDLVFSQNVNPETQVIRETQATLLGQHKEHKPNISGLQTIQLLATESVSKAELQEVNVGLIQQHSYVSVADESSEIASLTPDTEDNPLLRKGNGTPPIPSATPQELASGARRKIFTPKLQTEDTETASPSDNQPQKDEASTKSNTLCPGPENIPVSPSLSRRSPLLQPGGQRTPPTERRSPLLSRRKLAVDVAEPQPSQESIQQIPTVQTNEKPAGKDKQDPFKAPQVIRKIRGEPFSDASGHLKLWCQFFNVLADSTIRWCRDEVEVAQLERSAGDETPVNLAIVQASSRDCGVYGCSITNQHGTDSTDFLLSVDILAGMFLREELGVGEEIEMTPLVLSKGVADAGIWANKFFGRIMMQESHVGEGCSRKAWRAKVIYGLEPVFESGTTCVIKVRNAITYGGKEERQLLEKNLEVVQQECRIQNMAREYCKICSAEARVIEHFGPTLEVIPVYLMYRPANTVPHGTVETDLNGLYQKYCVVDAKGRLVMRTGSETEQKCCTLQHWIHQWTNGNLLFIRLEGVDTRITNVAISIKSPGYQGLSVAANPKVFEQFTSQHQCNYYCGLLGLRSLKALESLQTPARAKGPSRSPLLQRKLAAGSSSPQPGRKAAGSPRLPRKSESNQDKTAAKQ